ncbi:MAG: alpha/beta hydrolase [Porticoccaceae bacterium]|nr:alpha/beta hydrolase [Porticoccaceae bacterium]
MKLRSYLRSALVLVAMALPVSVYGAGESGSGQTLVLVHGAHLTADSWSAVLKTLRASGREVVAVNLPGRGSSAGFDEVTLGSSARSLCTVAARHGPKLSFVAHSQGGAVVNHLLGLCPEIIVEKIIYLAAVAPLHGEKPFEMLSKADEENYYRGVVYDEASGLMKIQDAEGFLASFAPQSHSEHSVLGKLILGAAVDEPAVIADGMVSLDAARFREIEKYYIYTRGDQIISLATQQRIASKFKLDDSRAMDSGHLPMFTQPAALSKTILGFLSQ